MSENCDLNAHRLQNEPMKFCDGYISVCDHGENAAQDLIQVREFVWFSRLELFLDVAPLALDDKICLS